MSEGIKNLAGTNATLLMLENGKLIDVTGQKRKQLRNIESTAVRIKAIVRAANTARIVASDISAHALDVPLIKISNKGEVVEHSLSKIKATQTALNIRLN
jgi:hypothetical protein